MSCKVVDAIPDEDVLPLPWLRSFAPSHSGGRKAVGAASLAGEAALLRVQIDEITTSAEQQARAAFDKGFQQGDAAARKQMDQEYRASAEKLAAAICEVSNLRVDTLQRAESDTVRLAVEIARRILHRELSVDSTALEGLVKAALDKLRSHEILRVRVHAPLAKLLTECIARSGRGQAIEVVADPALTAGAVVFEISRGSLDASLDTQLREIERGLVDELRPRA